jgi:peptidoglycan hydrolase CwlO-like protein
MESQPRKEDIVTERENIQDQIYLLRNKVRLHKREILEWKKDIYKLEKQLSTLASTGDIVNASLAYERRDDGDGRASA